MTSFPVILSLHYHHLLDPLQTGFKRDNSLHIALVKLTDDVRFAIDRRMIILLILLDFSRPLTRSIIPYC